MSAEHIAALPLYTNPDPDLKTPVIYPDAIDIAEEVIGETSAAVLAHRFLLLRDRIATKLITVDVTSRHQQKQATTDLLGDVLGTLIRVSEYLDQHSDIRDGEDGEPRPNAAMSLQQELEDNYMQTGLITRVREAWGGPEPAKLASSCSDYEPTPPRGSL